MEGHEDIQNQLKEYTSDEQFYKSYYEAKLSPGRLQSFLAEQSGRNIRKRDLICPELFPRDLSLLKEEMFFNNKDNRQNIRIIKHNRYSPAFIHHHEYFVIFYVLSGSCCHWINHTETVLSQGSLCFIAPYVDHSIAVNDDSIVLNILIQRTTFDDIFFNVLRSQNVLSSFFLGCLYAKSKKISHLIFHLEDSILPEILLYMMEEEAAPNYYTQFVLTSLINLFFVKLVQKYGQFAITSIQDSTISQKELNIISYINDHYKSVTLKQVAEHFNYNLEYCSRLIKNLTGRTFTQLLRSIRMRRAEILLLTTPCSIETLSFMVGYENPAAFIRFFKQEYGMTPGMYRRSKQADLFPKSEKTPSLL